MQAEDLVDTTEMYLKAVLELEEEGVVAMRARLAERFGHSGPTVKQTVSRMERDGLLVVESDRHLVFTDYGRAKATAVMHKHRMAEVFLDRVIGLDWEHVHQEACRWEHVMSDRVEGLLRAMLDDPAVSPYGNPVGGANGSANLVNFVRVAAEHDGEVAVTLAWIGEPLQADVEALGNLRALKLTPGCRAQIELHGPSVLVRYPDGERIELPHYIAAHLFTEQD